MTREATIDYILENFVGGSGRYQLWNTILMGLVYYAGIYPLFLTVFTAYEPDHRCRVDQCEVQGQEKVGENIFNASWLQYAIPLEVKDNFLGDTNKFDGCKRFQLITDDPNPINVQGLQCLPGEFSDNVNNTESCQEFVYDNTYFDETLTTKLDLVCDNSNLKKLLGTLLIIGLLFGSLIGGRIGDQFGRKKACFLAIFTIVPITIGAGYAPSYSVYAALHLITMTCLPVIWVNAYVYQTEIFSPKWRYVFVGIYEMPFHYYVFCLIVYLNRTWTGIHLWVGIATGISLPIWFLIPESPRWLAQNNHVDEAMKALVMIGKRNGRKIGDVQEKEMKSILEEIASESHKSEDHLKPWDMFRKGHAVKSLILCLGWITSCVSFYALTLNATDLSGHIVLNFTLSVSANFGTCLVILLTTNYFGRTKSLVASHTVLGLSCLALAFIPKDEPDAILGVYLVGKIVASISFSLVYLITIELYPTNLRSQAVGSCSMISRIFCAVAPFLGDLAEYWRPAPMLIIGIPILISGALALRLPETYDEELPQTMKNSEELEERSHHRHQHHNA